MPPQIKNILPEVSKRSTERVKGSKDFLDFKKDIMFYKKKLEQKSVSLNKKKRLTEFKKDSNVRKEREALIKRLFAQDDDDSAVTTGSKIRDDIYLKEALRIVSDLEMLEKAQAAK